MTDGELKHKKTSPFYIMQEAVLWKIGARYFLNPSNPAVFCFSIFPLTTLMPNWSNMGEINQKFAPF